MNSELFKTVIKGAGKGGVTSFAASIFSGAAMVTVPVKVLKCNLTMALMS